MSNGLVSATHCQNLRVSLPQFAAFLCCPASKLPCDSLNVSSQANQSSILSIATGTLSTKPLKYFTTYILQI